MAYPTVKKIALYCTGAFTGVALSVSIQSFANQEPNSLPVKDLRTFAEVYGRIKSDYVEVVSDDKIIQNAVKGMTAGLDPHSEYLPAQEFAELREGTSGEFGGLGIEIGPEDGFIKIIAPIEDTPAYRAGVKSGDLIVKINDVSTRDISLSEAVKMMRGKPGSKVSLTLARKDHDKPIVLSITRDTIKAISVRSKLLEPDYGYVRIAQFQERTLENMVEAITKMSAENKRPLKGLILDLRDDPGGLLTGAVGVSAAFLQDNAVVVSTKGRKSEVQMKLVARPEDYVGNNLADDPNARLPKNIKDIPIVVLVNSGSASASEIVAGALQDHKRAVIVGTQTFGKGSVQTVLPLSSGGGVKLTTALYYTPNDRSIQAKGIVPDLEVKDSATRSFEIREADLSGHLANPNGGQEVKSDNRNLSSDTSAPIAPKVEEPKKGAKADEKTEQVNPREPNPKLDVQLGKALELIKTPTEWQKNLGVAATKDTSKDKPSSKDKAKDSPKK